MHGFNEAAVLDAMKERNETLRMLAEAVRAETAAIERHQLPLGGTHAVVDRQG